MNRIKERFIQNSKGFWSGHRWVLALYGIALLADGISTIRFMLAEGVHTELHPAVNIAARVLGPVLGPLVGVFGKAVAGMIVAIYWRSIA